MFSLASFGLYNLFVIMSCLQCFEIIWSSNMSLYICLHIIMLKNFMKVFTVTIFSQKFYKKNSVLCDGAHNTG